MAEELKIEAGKEYRTEDGRRVFVTSIHHNHPSLQINNHPVNGIYVDDGNPSTWTRNGKWAVNGVGPQNDLVAEWVDPPPESRGVVALIRYRDGSHGLELFRPGSESMERWASQNGHEILMDATVILKHGATPDLCAVGLHYAE